MTDMRSQQHIDSIIENLKILESKLSSDEHKATPRREKDNIDHLLQQADEALYEATLQFPQPPA